MKKIIKGVITFALTVSLILPSTITVKATEFEFTGSTGAELTDFINQNASGSGDTFKITKDIEGAVIINKSNVTLDGDGKKGSINAKPGGGEYSVIQIAADNVTIQNLTINGENSNGSTSTYINKNNNIWISSGTGIKILNNDINIGYLGEGTKGKDGSIGLLTSDNSTNAISDLTVKGNTFKPLSGKAQQAFFINPGCAGATLDNNIFSGEFQQYSVIKTDGLKFINNKFRKNYYISDDYAAWMKGLSSINVRGNNVEILNNQFLNSDMQSCIHLSSNPSNVKIDNNNFISIKVGSNENFKNLTGIKGHENDYVGVIADKGTPELSSNNGNKPNFHIDVESSTGGKLYLYGSSHSDKSDTNSASTYYPTSPITNQTNDPYVYEGTNTTSTTNIGNAIIDLNGSRLSGTSREITIEVGDNFDIMEYITAQDNNGNGTDLTDRVRVSGRINTAVPGKYTLTYRVTGANGVTVTGKVVVIVTEKDSIKEQTGPAKCTPNASCSTNNPCSLCK